MEHPRKVKSSQPVWLRRKDVFKMLESHSEVADERSARRRRVLETALNMVHTFAFVVLAVQRYLGSGRAGDGVFSYIRWKTSSLPAMLGTSSWCGWITQKLGMKKGSRR